MAGHLGDGVAAAVEVEALADLRDVAEVEEQESGEGLDAGLAREGPAELRAEVAQRDVAVEREDAFGVPGCGAAGDVELVFQLADDLLERVLGGDDADGGTELVDDDGDLAAALLKFLQQLDGEFGLGDDGDLAHHLAQGEAGVARAAEAERDGAEVHQARDVLGVDDADDLLGAAGGVVDGDAGVLLFDDARAGLLDGHVGGQREDLAARRHDLANGDVVQLDGAMDDLFLEDRQQAHAARGGGDELELLGRVDGALAAERCAEEAQDQVAAERSSARRRDG